MGELIVAELMTMDGAGQTPGAHDEGRDGRFTHVGCQALLLDQQGGGVLVDQAWSMDARLLGRRTYEISADYWPGARKRARHQPAQPASSTGAHHCCASASSIG